MVSKEDIVQRFNRTVHKRIVRFHFGFITICYYYDLNNIFEGVRQFQPPGGGREGFHLEMDNIAKNHIFLPDDVAMTAVFFH